MIRRGIVLATSLYSVFAILDIYAAPESYRQFWVIRFVFVIPVLIIVYLFSFSSRFIRFSQPIMSFMFGLASLGIIAMIAISRPNEPAFRSYYVGLILVTIGQHAVIRLKNELSLALSIIFLASYNWIALVVQKLHYSGDLVYLIINNFFFISSIVVAYYACKNTEEMFRKDFFQRKELARSHEELDESNAIKTKLLSIIAHDLRGPLANTKAILDLLARGYITPNEFREKAGPLVSSVNSASQMLENLLSWSLFHIGKQKIVKEKIFLKEVIDNVFTLLKPHADQKLIKLVNSVKDESTIFAQSTLVELVVRNLVANAIKYTERGKVEVSAVLLDSCALVSVEDTGRGIPEEIARNLFNWDKKVTSLGTKKERGAGIGLLICKEFLEKHDGSICFRSQLGKGTTFTFKLGVN